MYSIWLDYVLDDGSIFSECWWVRFNLTHIEGFEASQDELLCIDIRAITVRQGFNSLHIATEHAYSLGLHSAGPTNPECAQCPWREADVPSGRWIYSTNKSDHHGVFSKGLRLLGHTCALTHTEKCSTVLSTHTHTHLMSKGMCKTVTHMQW